MSLECRSAVVSADGRRVLATVSAVLRAGRVTAIVGPNGTGKSTLLGLLAGQRAPLAGSVLLDGLPLHRQPVAPLARRRALMAQESAVAFDFSATEVVELGRFPHRHRPAPDEAGIVAHALAAAGVAHLAGRSVQTLSGGEKARVHLARALAQIGHPPADGAERWLLADEPTAALDLQHQHRCMRLLRQWAVERGVGVVAVLHDLNLALRYADDALVLGGEGGEDDDAAGCSFGPVAQVLQPGRIEAVWQMRCEPVALADGMLQYLFG